jgi:hypothetical protein
VKFFLECRKEINVIYKMAQKPDNIIHFEIYAASQFAEEYHRVLSLDVAQAVSRWQPGFETLSGHVGFMVDKAALG